MKTNHERVAIPCSKTVEFIELDKIVRLEGLQNYTRIFLANGTMLISSKNLGSFRVSLEDKGFFCCHKSHVINVDQIKRYHKEGYVEMGDTSSVPVSRRRKTLFLNTIYNLEPAHTA